MPRKCLADAGPSEYHPLKPCTVFAGLHSCSWHSQTSSHERFGPVLPVNIWILPTITTPTPTSPIKSDIPRGPWTASLAHPACYTSSPLSLREIEWILIVGTLQFSWTRLPDVPAQQHSCRNPLLLALATLQSLETAVLAGTPCTAEKIFHSQTPSDLEIL